MINKSLLVHCVASGGSCLIALSKRHDFANDQQRRTIDAGRIDHVSNISELAKSADLIRARAVLDDRNGRRRVASRSDKARGDHACRADAHGRGLPGPYILVAMSLGAMVALEWERGESDFVRTIKANPLVELALRP